MFNKIKQTIDNMNEEYDILSSLGLDEDVDYADPDDKGTEEVPANGNECDKCKEPEEKKVEAEAEKKVDEIANEDFSFDFLNEDADEAEEDSAEDKEDEESSEEADDEETLNEGPFVKNIDKQKGLAKVCTKVAKVTNKMGGVDNVKYTLKEITKDEYVKLQVKRAALQLFVISGWIGAAASIAVTHNLKQYYFQLEISNKNTVEKKIIIMKSLLNKSDIQSVLNKNKIKAYTEAMKLFEEADIEDCDDEEVKETSEEIKEESFDLFEEDVLLEVEKEDSDEEVEETSEEAKDEKEADDEDDSDSATKDECSVLEALLFEDSDEEVEETSEEAKEEESEEDEEAKDEEFSLF